MMYLDYNSTTPCAPEVIAAMQRFWLEDFGNPASDHFYGRKASRAVAAARGQVAALAGCINNEIVFTSGATESNNLLFLGLLLSDGRDRRKVAVSSIEHKSILAPAELLAEKGFDVVYLPVTRDGVIDLDAAREMISGDTALVSVQAANNEIGTIQPIRELASIAHSSGAFFHTDAAQALGKIEVDLKEWGCDFASFSAHKMYGPKGIGALFVKGGPNRWAWSYPFRGGGQEGNLRPGTSNVPAIIGFGEACRIASQTLNEEMIRQYRLRDYLEKQLLEKVPNCLIHGYKAIRLPGTVSVAFNQVPSDILIDNLVKICIGKGSACNGGSLGSSHVLAGIGCETNITETTVRISLGRYSTQIDIDTAIADILNWVCIIREKMKGRFNVAK